MAIPIGPSSMSVSTIAPASRSGAHSHPTTTRLAEAQQRVTAVGGNAGDEDRKRRIPTPTVRWRRSPGSRLPGRQMRRGKPHRRRDSRWPRSRRGGDAAPSTNPVRKSKTQDERSQNAMPATVKATVDGSKAMLTSGNGTRARTVTQAARRATEAAPRRRWNVWLSSVIRGSRARTDDERRGPGRSIRQPEACARAPRRRSREEQDYEHQRRRLSSAPLHVHPQMAVCCIYSRLRGKWHLVFGIPPRKDAPTQLREARP